MPAVPGLIDALEATVRAAIGDGSAAARLRGDTEEAAVGRARLYLRAGDSAAAGAEVEPFLAGARVMLRTTRTEA